jgi:thiosulfate reductase cytochrome b subunit
MPEPAYIPELAIPAPAAPLLPRHSATVRITHWVHTASFFGLLVSGIAILLAHPRLYWGETGAVGMPSLLDLPLPFVLTGQTGWGRSLHFLSAWLAVLNGAVYLLSGLATRRESSYNPLQRSTYFAVVFLLFPLMVATGLAMSPAIASVLPALVDVFGGTQSARTLHFFAASSLVLFLAGHIAMVCWNGFTGLMRSMTVGVKERS